MPFVNARSDADVFWKNVDRSGDCWIWTGATNGKGYGRVCIDQQYYPAHHVAWFLVMGKWPAVSLYRVGPCRSGVQGHQRGDPRKRTCVRPNHYRDGPNPSAPTRWLARAQNGFPPEFREASEHFLSSEEAEATMLPVLLYRGNLSMGRAQALFNWTMVVQAADAVRLNDVVEASRAWPDATHGVGLHRPITTITTVESFWGRLIDNPEVTAARPGMLDYIRTTLAASGRAPHSLQRIDRYSPWSTRDWRRVGQRSRLTEPLPTVWPYIEGPVNPEHDLVMVVDQAVPKGLPEQVRQDVCQDLILAVLEGQVDVQAVAEHSQEFIKNVFRQYPRKYGPLSLDAPAPWAEEDGRTLGDTLADAPIILGKQHTDWAAIRSAIQSREEASA